MSLTALQQLVERLARDTSGDVITTVDRDNALGMALARYSADVPRTLVVDLTWSATGYTCALPSDWVDGSYVVQAEYPVGQQPLQEIELAVYRTPSGAQLVTTDALTAGSVVRLTYAVPHTLNSTTDTTASTHKEAIASYAAHLLCKQMAAHYAGERDASIGADHSNTESRARNYTASAKAYRQAYYLGIGKADPQGAGAGAAGGSAGSVGEPAASVSSWGGRQRFPLVSNDVLGGGVL